MAQPALAQLRPFASKAASTGLGILASRLVWRDVVDYSASVDVDRIDASLHYNLTIPEDIFPVHVPVYKPDLCQLAIQNTCLEKHQACKEGSKAVIEENRFLIGYNDKLAYTERRDFQWIVILIVMLFVILSVILLWMALR